MINFKGVTPAPAPPISDPPTKPQRVSVQEPVPQVDAPQMKKQLTQDTVSFSGSTPYQQSKSAISAVLKSPEVKGNPMAEAALNDLKELAKQDPHNKAYQAEIKANLRNLHEEYKLSK